MVRKSGSSYFRISGFPEVQDSSAEHSALVVAQEAPDPVGARVHAYLHRVEGDEASAGYWYRRAERPHSQASLPEEWQQITTALLAAP